MNASSTPAIFLSYASDDISAASRLNDALTAAGMEVWFDRGNLGSGDEWDVKIRRQIKECVLFVPVISAATQARPEGYFRIEWELAAERAIGIAKGVPFILPVVIDDTREIDALVPERFLNVQWTRLPGGEVPPETQKRFLKLWQQRTSGAVAAQSGQAKAPSVSSTKVGVPIGRIARGAVLAAAVALGAYGLWHTWHRPSVKPVTAASAATQIIPAKSIAVLPFQNLSANQENAFFTDGVQDEILTHLAKVADLKVISRTSVMPYKDSAKRNLHEIASALGVAHVLEGSVQRAANRARVNAQLIDARSDAQLWAETYDRDLADVFAIQSEIAKTIVGQLQAKLSPSEKAAIEKPPTDDLVAYDLYLRARALYVDNTDQIRAKVKLPEAVRLLEEAVSRDPNFISALCLLAQVHSVLYFQGHDRTPDRLQKTNAAVQSALRVDPSSGEAHLAEALYHYSGFRDFAQARTELARARQTLPNNAEVLFYSGVFDYRQGDWESATRNIERAVEVDPRNLLYVQQMALCYQPQRRYADERRMWERALEIVPGDFTSRLGLVQVAANARGDMKPYRETLTNLQIENSEAARELDDPFYGLRERTPAAAARVLADYPRDGANYYSVVYPYAYWEGVVARWQGDNAKARAAFATARSEVEKILREQPDFPAALSLLGLIDAGLGRKEDAIREGRRACELLPMSNDAVDGVAFAVNLAQIYAWVDEKNLAIEQLAAPLKVPNDCHYGELLLHPLWEALRGDPRFEKIVASQAPK